MTVPVHIIDGRGSQRQAHVHDMRLSRPHSAILTLNERFLKFNPEFHQFLNADFGSNMNQNVAFGGTPVGVHNGIDTTLWTPTGGDAIAVEFDVGTNDSAIHITMVGFFDVE